MLTDYHLHLRPDDLAATAAEYFTASNVARYRAAAEERGIAELGVAEHIHRFAQALELWQHPFWREQAIDDLDAYCEWVRGDTDLRLGIEADYVPGAEDRTASLLAERDFDYVVGSVHFLRDEAVDMQEYSVWHSGSVEKVWNYYFDTLGEAARTGMFDIMAHPDLVKVWGNKAPRPHGDLLRYYERAIDGLVEGNVAIEVSTAGLRKPVGEIYPARSFIEMCLEAELPIALSSDAHVPEDVGRDYDRALELLAELGVKQLATFDRRRRRLRPIG